MDPNATLREIQKITAAYAAGVITSGEERANALDEMASHVGSLDEWLTRGGFLPDDWNTGRYVEFSDVVGTYVHDKEV